MASIQRLNYGTVKLAGKYNPPSFEDTRISVFGFLVKTAEITIVVDTGVGKDHAYIDKVFEPDRIELEHALSEFATTLGDVDCLVNSHLHFDHCGNNRMLCGIPHYVQAAEIEAAAGENYTINDWISDKDLVSVEDDFVLSDGVTLLATPGHTPGHQSILVETGDTKLLIAAQVVFSFDEFLRGGDPEVQAHEGFEDAYIASLNRLRALDADRIYLSHDVRTSTEQEVT